MKTEAEILTLLRKIEERYERIEERQSRHEEWQRATAGAVRNLYKAVDHAEDVRRAERDQRKEEDTELARMRQAILELIASNSQAVLSNATGEQLADYANNEAICHARNIQWARKKGEPEPLPLPPHLTNAPTMIVQETSSGNVEMVHGNVEMVHLHRRKDDSVAIKTDKDGHARLKTDIKLKTLLGWIVAGIAGLYEVIKAIKAATGH